MARHKLDEAVTLGGDGRGIWKEAPVSLMGRGREVIGLSRPGRQFSVREGRAARERRRRVRNQFHSEEVEA